MESIASFYMSNDTQGFRVTGTTHLPQEASVRGCALSVGDTVSFPNHRNRVYRVVSRHYHAGADIGEPDWLIELEPESRAGGR